MHGTGRGSVFLAEEVLNHLPPPPPAPRQAHVTDATHTGLRTHDVYMVYSRGDRWHVPRLAHDVRIDQMRRGRRSWTYKREMHIWRAQNVINKRTHFLAKHFDSECIWLKCVLQVGQSFNSLNILDDTLIADVATSFCRRSQMLTIGVYKDIMRVWFMFNSTDDR